MSKLDIRVNLIIEDLKKDPSSRFSKGDFQTLVYAVLSDPTFKAKKYLFHNTEILEQEECINDGLRKFLDKLLKHAGMADPAERTRVIDTFEYTPKDVEWVMDTVDEAMHIYTECGKTMRVFRNKMLQLAMKKIERSGKWAGKIAYKKMVTDRAEIMRKKEAKNG